MEEEEMQRLYNQEQEISRQRILLEMEREKMAEEEENKRWINENSCRYYNV